MLRMSVWLTIFGEISNVINKNPKSFYHLKSDSSNALTFSSKPSNNLKEYTLYISTHNIEIVHLMYYSGALEILVLLLSPSFKAFFPSILCRNSTNIESVKSFVVLEFFNALLNYLSILNYSISRLSANTLKINPIIALANVIWSSTTRGYGETDTIHRISAFSRHFFNEKYQILSLKKILFLKKQVIPFRVIY